VHIVGIYNINKHVTILVKNINIVVFAEQLMNKISSIFLILVPNPLVIERLVKIHSERIEGPILQSILMFG